MQDCSYHIRYFLIRICYGYVPQITVQVFVYLPGRSITVNNLFFLFYPVGPRRVCYMESTLDLNFHQAGLYCERHGVHLAKILDYHDKGKAARA